MSEVHSTSAAAAAAGAAPAVQESPVVELDESAPIQSAIRNLESLGPKLIKEVIRTHVVGSWKLLLKDYRVNCYGDESRFYKNKLLWETLPRGFGVITAAHLSDASISPVTAAVYGLRKFGYEQDPFAPQFSPPYAQEIYTVKENGECAHIAAFRAGTDLFFVVGSKNVHAALRNRDDIAVYTEQRYSYAMKIARLWFATYEALPADAQSALAEYLCREGVTLCAEACFADSQHIVDYNGQDLLTFYALSRAGPSRLGITAVPPLEALALLTRWGLPIVQHRIVSDVHDTTARQSVREYFETAPNMEGAVVYVLDASGVCRRMYKHKNYAYIVERAVRQIALRRGLSFDIARRMSALHFHHPCVPPLVQSLRQFNAWLRTELKTDDDWANLMQRWVTLRKKFATVPTEERERILNEFDATSTAAGQLQIMLVGLVGSGKSTLGVAAAHALGGQYINQDALGGRLPNFLREVRGHSADQTVPVLVMDKCHHTDDIRERTLSALRPGRLLVVELMHPEDGPYPVKTLELCRERIARRGTHHLTLLPGQNLFRIMDGFASSWQPVDDTACDVVRIDMTLDPASMLRSLLLRVAELAPETPAGARATAVLGTDGAVEAAVGAAVAREQSLGIKKSRLAFYGIDLGCLDDLPLPAPVREAIASGALQLQEQHHVTLAYVAGGDPTALAVAEQVKSLAGQRVSVRVCSVAWDARAAALVVEHTLPTAARISHVTLALAHGERPAYSNEMLHSSAHQEQPLPVGELQGVVMPYFTY